MFEDGEEDLNDFSVYEKENVDAGEQKLTGNTVKKRCVRVGCGASFMGKGHVYEAGVRVPLLVRWPATIKHAGGVSHSTWPL